MKRIEIIQKLRKYGFRTISCEAKSSDSYSNNLSLTISHESYPNVEAHLFTIADAAGWLPRILNSGDVEIRCPSLMRDSSSSWTRLLEVTDTLMYHLKPYTERISSGDIPSFIWAHHEFRWHRILWVSSNHYTPLPEKFIDYVDISIRPHILKLNHLGFGTMESCSGLPEDHPDREPYWSYVMFDERTYPGIAPHLFTLADMSSWDAKYAPHNFDVYLKIQPGADILKSFENLVTSAIHLHSLLKDHILSLSTLKLSPWRWRQQAFSIESEV